MTINRSNLEFRSIRLALALASLARPPARHPTMAGFRMPFVGPPLHQHVPFRHRAASVSGSLRPSATVAAWHPGPAAPFRGKASIPPVFVSASSGAAIHRDLPGFASDCVHPCPKNGVIHSFQPIPRRQPTRFRSSPVRITPLSFANQTKCKRSSHRTRNVG